MIAMGFVGSFEVPLGCNVEKSWLSVWSVLLVLELLSESVEAACP